MTTNFLYFTRITLIIRSYTCVMLFIVWAQTVIPYQINNYNVTVVYIMYIYIINRVNMFLWWAVLQNLFRFAAYGSFPLAENHRNIVGIRAF